MHYADENYNFVRITAARPAAGGGAVGDTELRQELNKINGLMVAAK